MKTSLLVDPELWYAFTAELRRMGMDYGQGVEMLAQEFLTSGTGIASLTRRLRELPKLEVSRDELHRMLDDIIDAGTHYMLAIYVNMELVHDAVRRNKDLTPEEMRRLRQLSDRVARKIKQQATEKAAQGVTKKSPSSSD